MSLHLFQDKTSGLISKIVDVQNPIGIEYLIDCDRDSFLNVGDFPIDSYVDESSQWIFPAERLVPAVAIDTNKRVLMQAFINDSALKSTIDSGLAHYFSRSRNKLWKKGEESGHLQSINKILFNSFYNFYIFIVEQNGSACHTNYYSCFYRKVTNGVEEIIYSDKYIRESK